MNAKTYVQIFYLFRGYPCILRESCIYIGGMSVLFMRLCAIYNAE